MEWVLFILLIIVVGLIFNTGSGGSNQAEEESGWIGYIVVAILGGGIFLFEKLRYLHRLEDIIRYLNARYKLYRKVETHTPWGSLDSFLKPKDKSEQEPWTRGEMFESSYKEAVLNSRKRLQKRLKKARIFEPLTDKKSLEYVEKMVEAYERKN